MSKCCSPFILKQGCLRSQTKLLTNQRLPSRISAFHLLLCLKLLIITTKVPNDYLYSLRDVSQVHRKLGRAPVDYVYNAFRRVYLIETGFLYLANLQVIEESYQGCHLYSHEPNRYLAVLTEYVYWTTIMEAMLCLWQPVYLPSYLSPNALLAGCAVDKIGFIQYLVLIHDHLDGHVRWYIVQSMSWSNQIDSFRPLQDTTKFTML